MVRREASVASASSVSGDDAGAEQHDVKPQVVAGPSYVPQGGDRGGGGHVPWHGTFGVYNGNWGGRRKCEWIIYRINYAACVHVL